MDVIKTVFKKIRNVIKTEICLFLKPLFELKDTLNILWWQTVSVNTTLVSTRELIDKVNLLAPL